MAESVNLKKVKELRSLTRAGFTDCRQALVESKGDLAKAKKWLQKKGAKTAAKKEERVTKEGLLEAYRHDGGRILAVVELLCETDFVSRTKEFKDLAHELAMQVAAMKPKSAKALLAQSYIRNEKRKIEDLLKEVIAKTGENIKINRLARFELGD